MVINVSNQIHIICHAVYPPDLSFVRVEKKGEKRAKNGIFAQGDRRLLRLALKLELVALRRRCDTLYPAGFHGAHIAAPRRCGTYRR